MFNRLPWQSNKMRFLFQTSNICFFAYLIEQKFKGLIYRYKMKNGYVSSTRFTSAQPYPYPITSLYYKCEKYLDTFSHTQTLLNLNWETIQNKCCMNRHTNTIQDDDRATAWQQSMATTIGDLNQVNERSTSPLSYPNPSFTAL